MKKTLIIAEAGVNHNGNILLAKELVDVAAEAGADFVKFQTFIPEQLVTANAIKAQYQAKSGKHGESQLQMLRDLQLSRDAHIELIEHAKKRNISFLSTGFSCDDLIFLNQLDLEVIKIPSGEITNVPYLEIAGSLKKPIILSTGMSTLSEVKFVLGVLMAAGAMKDDITLLHCTSEYPAPYSDVNLLAMQTLKNHFQTAVGYSDHTLGIEVSVAAVALGATVIEKHLTLDPDMQGPDHAASLPPIEFSRLVRSIRNIDMCLGSTIKAPTCSEIKNIDVVRKSIVAKKIIKKGDIFTVDNLTTKRPGLGLSPIFWNDVLGSRAAKDYQIDEFIVF